MSRSRHLPTAVAITVWAVLGLSPRAGQSGVNVWTSLGPEGGNIGALAIHPVTPQTLYAGTGGGVFKSTDGGGTWTAMNGGLLAACRTFRRSEWQNVV